MGKNFRTIKAWQFADDLAAAVYEMTSSFPADERYGLNSQMRRAAVSVAANIAEGANRASHREYVQFLSIAKGSLAELEYYLHFSKRLNYCNGNTHQQLLAQHRHAARTLEGLIRSIRQRHETLVVQKHE